MGYSDASSTLETFLLLSETLHVAFCLCPGHNERGYNSSWSGSKRTSHWGNTMGRLSILSSVRLLTIAVLFLGDSHGLFDGRAESPTVITGPQGTWSCAHVWLETGTEDHDGN